jgi:cytochrome P450
MVRQHDMGTKECASLSVSQTRDGLKPDPFAQMRLREAVVRTPFPTHDSPQVWMVTRMEEALQVLKESQRFTVDLSTIDGGQLAQRKRSSLLGQAMLSFDGLDHRRLRGLVSRIFTPKYIQSLRPSIQQIADMLLDRVQGQGRMDLVEDYAYPLPINVISEMLGVPQSGWHLVREGSRALVEMVPLILDEKSPTSQTQRIQAFSDYITQLVTDKRHHPQNDLISQLIQIEEEGDRLSEPELLSMVALLIVAGHETTSNLIGNGMLALLDQREQLETLRADPSLVPAVVEELLRLVGPALTSVPRFATEDVELGGQFIARGDIVIVALDLANHDENHFTNRGELERVRQKDRHLAFGYGIHICLGAPLARLEGDIAFTTLLSRLPKLRLNTPRESITWLSSPKVRGLTSLPVAF